MDFKEKYTTDDKETKKRLISEDAYAIGEQLERLNKNLEKNNGR
jgi:hypothetical protein